MHQVIDKLLPIVCHSTLGTLNVGVFLAYLTEQLHSLGGSQGIESHHAPEITLTIKQSIVGLTIS